MAEFSEIDTVRQTIPGTSPPQLGYDLGLSLPDSVLSGTLRGTQNVGAGGTKIDSANNIISITDPTSGVTINVGDIPTTGGKEIGLSVVDSSGFVLFKLSGQTWFWYDKNNNTNVMRAGLLPDGTYNWVVATTGHDVGDLFI